LERRVEDLLDGRVEPVDLVDEEDVSRIQGGEDRREVSLPLERRPRDRPDGDVELFADDVGEARLAEARRADEQEVVERLASPSCCVERDSELLLEPLLTDELVEAP